MNIGLEITKPRYTCTAGLLRLHPTLWNARHLANLPHTSINANPATAAQSLEFPLQSHKTHPINQDQNACRGRLA